VQHVTLKSIANNPDIKEGMSREEIDAAIRLNAEYEVLYDKPYPDGHKVRVTGPFTVESLSPHRSLAGLRADEPVAVKQAATRYRRADPTTGDIRSDGTDQVALWMIDTDYDGESFFVRHCYFTCGQDPYARLKKALKADIDEEAWASLLPHRLAPVPDPLHRAYRGKGDQRLWRRGSQGVRDRLTGLNGRQKTLAPDLLSNTCSGSVRGVSDLVDKQAEAGRLEVRDRRGVRRDQRCHRPTGPPHRAGAGDRVVGRRWHPLTRAVGGLEMRGRPGPGPVTRCHGPASARAA